MTRLRLAAVLALAAGAALALSCSDNGPNPASDAGSDATADRGSDANGDGAGGTDARPDTRPPPDTGRDALAWTPPYSLPGPGEKKEIPIAGRNTAVDVKPPAHDKGSWQYALFQSYGGGSFSADYSVGGAYVIAGTGGHNAAPNFGAAIFDFTDGKWSYLANANGFDENRTSDVDLTTETNGAPHLELTKVTSPGMPAPGHTYLIQISPPKSVLGGSKGAIVHTVGAARTTAAWDSPQSHKLDLATGLWSRASDNLRTAVSGGNPFTDSAAAYDAKTKRIYHLAGFLTYISALPYLDLADNLWKKTASFSSIDGSSSTRTMFVDEARRLLVVIDTSAKLHAWDLENIAAGPTQLTVSGTVPTDPISWNLYPIADGGDGSYYAFRGRGATYGSPPYPLADDQSLHKLTPPDSSPLTSPWTFSKVPISGGLTAEYVADSGSGARHHSRFFYVPSLHLFAWIPNGTGAVELIKP